MKQRLDGRLKTMLQSIDTARYHEDKLADRMTDIAHARSEILSAMLFGYEIVLPAGAIADCPALIELIPEVFDNAAPHLAKINKLLKVDYKLFRVGLESKYISFKGRSGYSAFVADYLESKLGSAPNMVALMELAKQSGWSSQLITAALGQAYLERDWRAIDNLGSDMASAVGDDTVKMRFDQYRRYAQCVYQFLEPGEHTQYAARPLFSDTSFITDLEKSYFYRQLMHLLSVSEARHVHEHKLTQERKVVDSIYKEICNGQQNPAERGSWYGYQHTLSNEGMWNYTRNWLDVILYDYLRIGFEVSVPSYFTQELDPIGPEANMTLSLASHSALSEFCESEKRSGSPDIEHPQDMVVDWEAIWRLIAHKDYQISLSAMTDRYKEALNRQWQELATSLDQKYLKNHRELVMKEIVQRRRNAMNAAFDDHIAFLNEKFKNFKLKNRNGKVTVQGSFKIPPKKVVKKVLGTVTGLGEVFDPAFDLLADTVSKEISDQVVDKYWRGEVEKPSKIDVVVRPANLKIVDNKSFIDAERNRINFWITA